MPTLIDNFHQQYVYGRRVRVLADHLISALAPHSNVLDIGTGDGLIASRIQTLRPDLKVTGADILVRRRTEIPVVEFDGGRLPFDDGAFDIAMLIDVLHHTDDPLILLREAARVARQAIVVKDHVLKGVMAGATLRFMDWIGNARHGVALPYNYWSQEQWNQAFGSLGGCIELWNSQLGIYCHPFSLFFDRRLHFLAKISLPPRAATISADEQHRTSLLSGTIESHV